MIDAVLAAKTQSRVAKGAATWAEASAETITATPALVNLRCCGVSDLPYADAVAMLRKAEREGDYADKQTIGAWLAALDALHVAVKPRPAAPKRVEKSRTAHSGGLTVR